MRDDAKSILLVGVGGQGTILASKILSEGLLLAGYDVKMSEIHGMSQRGGSVSTQIRFGKKVYSPIIGIGEADVLVAFERMEALRYLEYLKPSGSMIVNDYEIPSLPVLMGVVEYPEGITEELKAKTKLTLIEAQKIAVELGNPKTMNIVLLGAAVKALNEQFTGELADIDWPTIIKNSVKEDFVDINIKAFELGSATATA